MDQPQILQVRIVIGITNPFQNPIMRRSTVTLGLTLSLIMADSNAAAVTGWATTSTTVTLSNTSTASPTWGSGAADNAKASNLYASFPSITLAAVGDAVTLTGSAPLVGANVTGTHNGFLHFGLFDVNGKSDTNG